MDSKSLETVDKYIKAIHGRGLEYLDKLAVGDPLEWLLNRERERILAEEKEPEVEQANGRPKFVKRMRVPTSEIVNS